MPTIEKPFKFLIEGRYETSAEEMADKTTEFIDWINQSIKDGKITVFNLDYQILIPADTPKLRNAISILTSLYRQQKDLKCAYCQIESEVSAIYNVFHADGLWTTKRVCNSCAFEQLKYCEICHEYYDNSEFHLVSFQLHKQQNPHPILKKQYLKDHEKTIFTLKICAKCLAGMQLKPERYIVKEIKPL